MINYIEVFGKLIFDKFEKFQNPILLIACFSALAFNYHNLLNISNISDTVHTGIMHDTLKQGHKAEKDPDDVRPSDLNKHLIHCENYEFKMFLNRTTADHREDTVKACLLIKKLRG